MNMPFSLSDAFIQALGWTLVHSLWQGAAAAVVCLLILPRLRSAQQRYWTAYGALLTILVAAVVTFLLVIQPPTDPVAAASGTAFQPEGESSFFEQPYLDSSIWNQVSGWLEARNPLIVAIWLLGLAFFFVRLIGGVIWVQQLRRQATQPLDAIWNDRIQVLAQRLGHSRPVQLLESALVRVPLTLGWLRPLVLLPIGMINRLSVAEVEAILAHELAHVARRDWLLNLLQAVIEALFYFHPAVWWLSATVRTERENCCDDLAVALTGNRLAYAKALVQVQEMARSAPPTPALTLAATGAATLLPRRRYTLLDRIQRILNQQHKKSQLMEKFVATALLAALAALWGTRPANAEPLTAALGQLAAAPLTWFEDSPDQEPTLAPVASADTDSVPQGRKARQTQKIVQEDDGRRVEMEVESGQVTRLNIDGKEIPAAEFAQHQALTDQLRREMAPTPPTPPVPGVWATPPVPAMAPMAPMEGMPAMPPMPAMAPMAPMSPASRIITEKDAQGNTIIRLERAGDPTEITVKDGQVWIDGRQVQPGEAVDLPGDLPSFYWNGGEGQAFGVGEGQFFQLAPGQTFAQGWNSEDYARVQQDLEKMMAERKIMDKNMKRQEKEMAKQRKQMNNEQRQEMERMRQDMDRAMQERGRVEAEMQRAQVQRQQATRDMYRARAEAARSNDFGQAFKAELRRDGLIADPRNYSVQMNERELTVNGKKQSDALHRKYLELYRTKTGQDLGAGGNINIVENND